MKIALSQQNSSPDRAANLERAFQAMEEAAAQGAELIAFPEVVLDRFFPCTRCSAQERAKHQAFADAETIPGPTIDKLAAKAKELGLVTVFNLFEVDGDRYYDSSPVIDADGTLLGTTRMAHITDYEGFYEQDYYDPGDSGAAVYDTRVGKIGVAICYDRHYPEYMRALAVGGAELVVIPQAGCIGEWPEGLYEAEVRTAAFQNGYFTALCNRVGVEEGVGDAEGLTFAGESFVVDPDGRVLARAATLEDDLLVVDIDLSKNAESSAKKLFFRDRRPDLYLDWARREVEQS